ncbi:MAG TPA: DNA polymerase III subunit delta [Bacteroidia bacterium]|nr:DNA polymerase III subunit delta [Bacteroidia bacterium]
MLFRDIIGQSAVKQRLVQGVHEQRISHAQLFFGPEGSGTLPLAFAYARYVHCTARNENDSCGTCPSCQKYDKLVHPDLHLVYPIALSKDLRVSTKVIKEFREAFLEDPYITLNDWFLKLDAENKQPVIATEESAEILKKLSLTTFEGEYKIMLIWMAEKMNLQAANKLLKILEEPPDKTLFILVTENEDQLLRTIISRTQLVKIPRLSDDELRTALIEHHEVNPENASRVAFQADGSYSAAKHLLEKDEQAIFNLQVFQKWMRACLKFDAPKVLESVDDFATAGRERQKQFLSYALEMVRESLLVNYADSSMIRIAGDEKAFVVKFAPFVHAANAYPFMEQVNLAYQHIERNGSAKIIFLDLSFKANELLNVPNPDTVKA